VSEPAETPSTWVTKIQAGDRRALARAITLVESTAPEHQRAGEDLLAALPAPSDRTIRVGISGAPGVGKSTFIEAFGCHLTAHGSKVAVLAIDPSSKRTGGSILGDKTRMDRLARDPNAFIRPQPSGGTLGGVARRTREAIALVEAAGFDRVIVETVGVGQSETHVADLVDMFVLLVGPAAGDDLQGIKRGIMELADLVVITKADGPLLAPANLAAADMRQALHLVRPKTSFWTPSVTLTSAMTGAGLDEVRAMIEAHAAALSANGARARLRAGQAQEAFWAELRDGLLARLMAEPGRDRLIADLEARVASGYMPPRAAARAALQF
jgi:LAO/AO transport system kinase